MKVIKRNKTKNAHFAARFTRLLMNTNYLIRKTHRWLGVLIGIQFLAWSLGGLYFSWSDMDEVHGDHEKKPAPLLPLSALSASPIEALESLRRTEGVTRLTELRLVPISGRLYWQIVYQKDGKKKTRLADALSGFLRPPLTEKEAREVALNGYAGPGTIVSVEYLTETNPHHEYRENPLPAYAFTFDDARHTTVYVAAESGAIQKVRNRPWRRFDFLWMLHTMDFSSRDNIGNWLLRAFSIFGVATVCSGFLLFFVSRKKGKR